MKLTFRLLTVYLITMAMLTFFIGCYSAFREWQLLVAESEYIAELLADKYKPQIIESWQKNSDTGIEEVVAKISPHNELVTVKWRWFHKPDTHKFWGEQTKRILSGIAKHNVFTIVKTSESKSLRIFTYVTIVDEVGIQGGLEFDNDADHLSQRLWSIFWTSVFAITTMFLFSAVISIYFGFRWIGKPLSNLVDQTSRIGTDDFDPLLNLKSTDELQILGDSLNRLNSKIQTQKKQIETETQEKIDAINQLRHNDRLHTIGQLASGVAHELGTPLNVVLGNAELIAEGTVTGEGTENCATTIIKEITRINKIVKNLLDFARRNSPQKTTVDLEMILQKTIDLLNIVSKKTQVHLIFNSTNEPAFVFADEDQLKQVFLNVIVNAIQASGVQKEVRINLSCEDSTNRTEASPEKAIDRKFWIVEIRDEGMGIAKNQIDQIFEPFVSTKAPGEGTGLGLSITRAILNEHGGWIKATSTAGKGSTFSIYLPRKETK